jgi:hypothetical protein
MSRIPSTRARSKLVGAALVTALVLSACGGDDDDDASSSTPAETTPTASSEPADSTPATTTATSTDTGSTAPGATDGEPTPGSVAPASGEPYIVYTMDGGNSGDVSDAIDAIEAGVNARGGLAGRPIDIVLCDDQNDPNKATACAQQAVDDGAIAVIGAVVAAGSQAYPILQEAGIASIGDQYFSQDQFSAANAFPFNAGTFVPVAAAAAGVKYFEQPNVLVTTIDVPAGRGYPPLINGVVTPVGGAVTAEVYIPFTATDLAPFAAELVGQEGVLSEGNTVDIGIRLGKELLSQGFDEPVIYNNSTWDAFTVEENFGNPTNAYLGTGYDLESEAFQMFDADMNEYAPNEPRRIGAILTRWAAANVLARISSELPEISAASVLDYFNTATSIDTMGLTPPLNFTEPNDALGGAMSRVSNDLVVLYHFEAGSWVRVTEFEDLLP